MLKDSLRLCSKASLNHDGGTMPSFVVRFAVGNYGDIVGSEIEVIKIVSPSRKRKVLSKRSKAGWSSGEFNSSGMSPTTLCPQLMASIRRSQCLDTLPQTDLRG